MDPSSAAEAKARVDFERSLAELHPAIHRYCARMAGSALDGEDLVQEVFVKAIGSSAHAQIRHLKSWLFSVAHSVCVDFLRRKKRLQATLSEEDPDMTIDEGATAEARNIAALGLKTFMQLPTSQRACVILADVLGYSTQEIVDITGLTVPAVKALLHRGRIRIREIADADPVDAVPSDLSQSELKRLASYVDRFNARDFDAVRDLLADDVRLELVARTKMEGRQQVSGYFNNYSGVRDWLLVPGVVDQQPAILVFDPANVLQAPSYFVVLEWREDKIVRIRDFRHARYATECSEMQAFGPIAGRS